MNHLRELTFTHTVALRPTPPFHFDATFHKPSHFPSSDNLWQPGARWQTMLWQGAPLGLKFVNAGDVDHPVLELKIWSFEPFGTGFLSGLLAEIHYRYNLGLDLQLFNQRFAGDPQLGPAIQRWRGMRPMSYSSLYEYLIIAIVLQNATVRRSVNMLQALFDQYGTRLAFDERNLSCFWPAERIAAGEAQMPQDIEFELRQLKVGYRARSILSVSQAFLDGKIDELGLRQQPLENQRRDLLGLYGVGPASVGYILFDVFHHLDEFSHISPWEQKIYSKLFLDRNPESPTPVSELLALFEERFGGYKMLAVNYLWEDLFWQRKNETVPWLDKLIRL